MIKINVTVEQGRALLDRAEACPEGLAGRVLDLTDPALTPAAQDEAIPDAASDLANLVFGDVSGPWAGHRREAIRRLYRHDPRISHIALADEDVSLRVPGFR